MVLVWYWYGIGRALVLYGYDIVLVWYWYGLGIALLWYGIGMGDRFPGIGMET